MASGRKPSLMRNVLSNWTVLLASIAYTILITPTVVRALDREEYGIWSFLNAFVAYSNLFYLGLGAALLRFGSAHYASRNRAALNRLLSVTITIYTGLGMLSLLVGVMAAPFAPELLSDPVDSSRSVAVSATVIVLASRVGLMFVGSVFSGVLVAQGRMDLHNLVSICGHFSRLLVVPLAVASPNPLFALALTVLITSTVEVIAVAVVAFRKDPDLKMQLALPTAAELRMLYGYGLFAFLLQLADRLISYTDTLVIGIMLGVGDVALYVLPLQLVEYGRLIVRGLVSVMLPHLSALVATGQHDKFRYSYLRTVRVTALVAAFVSVNLVAVGPMFLRLWVGPAFAEKALPVLACLAVAAFAQAIAVQSQTPFCMALGRVGAAAALLLVEAATNLGLSVFLARERGIVGVALATAIPAVFVSGLFLTRLTARQVDVSVSQIVRRALLPASALAIALSVTQLVIGLIVRAESYPVLLLRLALVSVVAVLSVWWLSSDSERRAVRIMVARRRNRRDWERELAERTGEASTLR